MMIQQVHAEDGGEIVLVAGVIDRKPALVCKTCKSMWEFNSIWPIAVLLDADFVPYKPSESSTPERV
jgi:hypothetical protein